MVWFVGVDVGGTFTDFFAFHAVTGETMVHKTPSTPANPAMAITSGLQHLASELGLDPRAIERFSHGTTVATNALLQRKGGRVMLATTRGFKDLIEIGRQIRPKMYSLTEDYPDPVVRRPDRVEVAERVLADGNVRFSLTDAELDRVAGLMVEARPDACAICFLFAHINPEHERRLAERIEGLSPGMPVSRSSLVQPEFREYERLSTTVINAYLQPLMDRYLETLGRDIAEIAPRAQIGINQSSGGLMSIDRARRFPVRTALSGPAAGAMGAVHVAALSGCADVVTLDMGGTSADVCLIRNFAVENSFEREVGGFPIRLPVVDINSVGAGGGSIAWFGPDGLLKVGPQSAGADPGPACYGKGGTLPTVSDANAVLGRLGGRGLLGGRMHLDVAAARAVIAPLAERLGFTVERAALGILDIVDHNMVRAIRAVSVEKGYDPRELVLMPFGGAGPLHATGVARALGIRRVLVPLMPGILCAQGLIVSDHKEDFVQSVKIPVEAQGMPALADIVATLSRRAAEWFEEERIPDDAREARCVTELRYVGQNYELPVRIEPIDQGTLDARSLLEGFWAAHERAYGYHSREAAVEVINVRLSAFGRLRKPEGLPDVPPAQGAAEPSGRRNVQFGPEGPVSTPVFDRAELRPGHVIAGPAVIDQLDATTLVFPGDRAAVDAALNILVEISA
jgi:N-methylhydantoinase A